jgi:ribosome biogenesis GTPase
MIIGKVIKSTGSWYLVRTPDGVVECRAKGKIRIEHTLKATNPVAVGDNVMLEIEPNQATGIISQVVDRQNYIIRRSTNLSKQVQIIAANIHQAIVVTSLAQPDVPMRFIDRFLVTAEAYHITPLIILNKCDLLHTPELRAAQQVFTDIYTSAGYQILCTNGLNATTLTDVLAVLEGKISLFSGFSGVGKSSIINSILPDLHLRTGEISNWSQKGMHTTTFAEMHQINENTQIIDTPGIKSLGLIDISKTELSHYFPDMRPYIHGCKFHNCTHTQEPSCAVKAALDQNKIHPMRYESYLAMLDNENDTYR